MATFFAITAPNAVWHQPKMYGHVTLLSIIVDYAVILFSIFTHSSLE